MWEFPAAHEHLFVPIGYGGARNVLFKLILFSRCYLNCSWALVMSARLLPMFPADNAGFDRMTP